MSDKGEEVGVEVEPGREHGQFGAELSVTAARPNRGRQVRKSPIQYNPQELIGPQRQPPVATKVLVLPKSAVRLLALRIARTDPSIAQPSSGQFTTNT